jgi:hypothetical protein
MKITQYIKASPALSLYLASFDDFDDNEYDCFVAVAFSEEEAYQLTPEAKINYYIGSFMGYGCLEVNPRKVNWYRNLCCRGKSIQRLGEAGINSKWGDIYIASFNEF